MVEVTEKLERATQLALRRRAKRRLDVVPVSNPHEADLILELLSSVPGPTGTQLRERICAIALFEPTGLHVKRAGAGWEALEKLSAPAVILCPPGILSSVLADDRIKCGYVRVSQSRSDGDRGCRLGCLILTAIAVLWIFIMIWVAR